MLLSHESPTLQNVSYNLQSRKKRLLEKIIRALTTLSLHRTNFSMNSKYRIQGQQANGFIIKTDKWTKKVHFQSVTYYVTKTATRDSKMSRLLKNSGYSRGRRL